MTIDQRNRVRLRINGTDYGGWTSVEIAAGIERVARDFRLNVTDRWPGAGDLVQRIKPFDRCEVWIGHDKVLTGSVDAIPVSYDDQQVSVSISGRSITADLVDCAAINEPGQWRGLRLEAIARALAGEYGIKIVNEANTGAVIAEHQIQQGETAFESLDRLLKLRQVLATDDAEGRLVLTVPSQTRAADALQLGENILKAEAGFRFQGRFQPVPRERPARRDRRGLRRHLQRGADEMDANIPRRRVMVVRQQGQSDGGNCGRRATYERARRMTKALEATITVQGWRQSNGELWLPNRIVRLRDGLLRLDRDMLIAEVTYRSMTPGRPARCVSVRRRLRGRAAGSRGGKETQGRRGRSAASINGSASGRETRNETNWAVPWRHWRAGCRTCSAAGLSRR
jgi:prophage tail gpP-like protein